MQMILINNRMPRATEPAPPLAAGHVQGSPQMPCMAGAPSPARPQRRQVLGTAASLALLGGCASTPWRDPAQSASLPPVPGQPAQPVGPWGAAPSASLPGTFAQDVQDPATGLTWRLWVQAPQGPAPADGHPVLYVLDGNASFALAAQLARNSDARPQEMRPNSALVVGIGYPGDAPFHLPERRRDYTPPPTQGPAPAGTGGADRLLDFLAREVQPRIAQVAPVDAQRQTLWGHSLGGLLVLHALFTRPGQWSRYAATSPSVWWNQGQVLASAQQFMRTHTHETQRAFHLQLQLRAGALERAHAVPPVPAHASAERKAVLERRAAGQAQRRLVESTETLAQELAALQWPQLRVDMAVYEGLDHGQTLVRGLIDALALAQQPRDVARTARPPHTFQHSTASP
jgi:predicted alpha/beta superfamily hydrolase